MLSAVMLIAFNGVAAPPAVTAHPRAAPGDVIQVFNNAWMYQNSLGMVYDPDRGIVRYAHESQSSSHRPTIFDVHPVTHTAVLSIALSTQNARHKWRWQIDNRDGAGYDYIAKTYFLPDYQGDLSYADDNIVEIDANGSILNAWEMDDEVGSNDSADGSGIDTIIDIAIVPGGPNRYFVAAAYDDSLVYEIVLTRTGSLWTPRSWSTLAACRLPGLTDNLGIDYDAQHRRLYHSDWKSQRIVVTDLACGDGEDMNVLYEFTCPGAGGYNSGVTFIEGSDPPEIWVTDFDKNKTTRCEAVGSLVPDPGWEKTVDGVLWTAGLSITTQTSDTFGVTDVITAGRPFTLTDLWDNDRLQLIAVRVEPPLADVFTVTGALTVMGDAATPEMVTVTKHFLTLPSTWTHTLVSETLDVVGAYPGDDHFFVERPFTVNKLAPVLDIGSAPPSQEVYAGGAVKFTLSYTNTGGFENAVSITSTFFVTAPFLYADPKPDSVASDRTWARWDVGNLVDGDSGEIDVYVFVAESVDTGTSITLTSGLYNHIGGLEDEIETVLAVVGEAAAGWTKTLDDGSGPVVWSPMLSLTLETYDTFTVTDVITTQQAAVLTEAWLPSELALTDWSVQPLAYTDLITTGSGWLNFNVPFFSPLYTRPITLTKVFTVETCSWPHTVLWEQLTFGTSALVRPVFIYKDAPLLALTAPQPDAEVYGGEFVTYTLTYSNAGGYESRFSVRTDLPADMTFEASEPLPTTSGAEYAEWVFAEGLERGEMGQITITAKITDEVPPHTQLEIDNTLLDHGGVSSASAPIVYEIGSPTWEKYVNGNPWDEAVLVEPGDIFTVTEVITSQTAFTLVDRWTDEHLTLLAVTYDAGAVIDTTGQMTWTVPADAPETVTLNKSFRTEAFTTAYTVLWEDLYVGGVELERRAVTLERAVPDLRLTKSGIPATAEPGGLVTYTFAFSNAGTGTATGVVLTDTIPVSVTGTMFTYSGAAITHRTGTRYVWDVSNLASGAGGLITVTGVLSDPLSFSLVTNAAEIRAANEAEAGGASPGDDAGGVMAAASINVINRPAFTSTPIITATQGMPYAYTVTATDPDLDDGDVLTMTAPTLPGWLTLSDQGDGTAILSGTPADAHVGQNAVTLRVTDGWGLTDTQTFVITVWQRLYLPLVLKQ
jgi:uncharacterized repeat protein (TIGR01451 family)